MLEKFELEFNNCETISDKKKLLENIIESIDLSDYDNKLFVKECKDKINDIIELESIESDTLINIEIEDGIYKLYNCIKSIDDYKSGSNYYVKVDDPRDFYLSTGIGETNPIIQNMINSIKPIYYIILDDGIGTLKRKNILSKDIEFSEHFTKFA